MTLSLFYPGKTIVVEFPVPEFPPQYLWVGSHDGVVAVIVQQGGGGVQGTGSVRVAADPVVLTPLGDLLAVFKPVNLHTHTHTHTHTHKQTF